MLSFFENDSPSRELAQFVKVNGDGYVPDLTGLPIARADRFLRGGDQESFNAAGFTAIRFTEPVENFAHQHQECGSRTACSKATFAAPQLNAGAARTVSAAPVAWPDDPARG